jgi:hypothetical protein
LLQEQFTFGIKNKNAECTVKQSLLVGFHLSNGAGFFIPVVHQNDFFIRHRSKSFLFITHVSGIGFNLRSLQRKTNAE